MPDNHIENDKNWSHMLVTEVGMFIYDPVH